MVQVGATGGTYGATAASSDSISVPNLTINSSGHITNVENFTATLNKVKSTDTAVNTDYFLTFTATGTTTSELLKSSSGKILKFNPSTGLLTATGLTGTFNQFVKSYFKRCCWINI